MRSQPYYHSGFLQLVAEGYISETKPGVAGSIPACVREMGLISGLCDQTFPEKTLVYEDGPRKCVSLTMGSLSEGMDIVVKLILHGTEWSAVSLIVP